MKEQILIECRECLGTGLYKGFLEKEDEAVICLACDGTGCQKLSFTFFSKRKKRRGIKNIRHSGSRLIAAGAGGHDKSMSYSEFEQAYPDVSEGGKHGLSQ